MLEIIKIKKWSSLPFWNRRCRWTTAVTFSVLITELRQLWQGCATFERDRPLLDSCHTVSCRHEQLFLLLPVVVAVAVSFVYALASFERRFQRFERFGREENVRIGCGVDWGWRNGVARMNPENKNKFCEIKHQLRSIEYLLLNFSSTEMEAGS